MRVLILGATGYVGSAVARAFKAHGCDAYGLARNEQNRFALANAQVTPVDGSLDDLDHLAQIARGFDVVVVSVMVPFEAETPILRALIRALRGGKRHLLFTSGTGVLSIESLDGAWNDNTFAEDDPFPFAARENRRIRVETEELVRRAAAEDLHTTVIRPPLIYGHGGSIQVPQLFDSARKTGAVCYLGHGLNLYSNVHVDDLAEAYVLAVEKGVAGALYHTVAGEVNFRTLAEAIAQVVGCGTRSLDYAQACEVWGSVWVDLALAVNSRSRCPRTRAELGWVPKHFDLVEDIRSGSYRDAHLAAQKTGGRPFEWKSHGSLLDKVAAPE